MAGEGKYGLEGRPMRKKLRQPAKRSGLLCWGLLLFGVALGARTAWAQYPSGPQVTKDGTVVVLQDYASLPLSSRTTGGYPPALDFSYQLGRANFLRSEPGLAPSAKSSRAPTDTRSRARADTRQLSYSTGAGSHSPGARPPCHPW